LKAPPAAWLPSSPDSATRSDKMAMDVVGCEMRGAEMQFFDDDE
jgi:hypothetical protein